MNNSDIESAKEITDNNGYLHPIEQNKNTKILLVQLKYLFFCTCLILLPLMCVASFGLKFEFMPFKLFIILYICATMIQLLSPIILIGYNEQIKNINVQKVLILIIYTGIFAFILVASILLIDAILIIVLSIIQSIIFLFYLATFLYD